MRKWAIAVSVLLLAGCGAPPGDPPPPSAPPRYLPLPQSGSPVAAPALLADPVSLPFSLPGPQILAASGSFDEGWDSYAPGAVPADWKDVRHDGYDYPWLVPGRWAVASIGGYQALEQTEMRQQPALSFRRYAGTAFGTPSGQLPAHYRAQVWLAAYGSPSYAPTGDQGVPLYYLDPTHYIEVLIKPDTFEAWECDGGQPNDGAGWKRLYSEQLRTRAGQQRELGLIVDSAAGTAELELDGKIRADVSSPLIRPETHYLALRSAGNQVAYFEVRAEAL